METYVVRVWLPDRPGALGQVASRIGAVHGDVVGIEILERGGGSAIDELTVTIASPDLVDLLISEIRQVDGVAVEDVRPVRADRPGGSMAALVAAESIVVVPAEERLQVACCTLRTLVDGDWSVIMSVPDGTPVATCGDGIDVEWLSAFLSGSEHLGNGAEHTPGDLVWSRLPRLGMAIASGRGGRVFHARERQEVHVLGRILDAVARPSGA
ncbi:MAG: ACT domain-containing protein [Ilumatobacteraceae bacterium]